MECNYTNHATFREAFHNFVLMKGADKTTVREIRMISYAIKPMLILLLLIINFNQATGQFWKFKSNVNKIDSLEEVINRDRESYNNELIQYHSLTIRLASTLDSLRNQLEHMQDIIDSLGFEVRKNTVRVDSTLTPHSNTYASKTFCPDDTILQQVKYLQNCCCISDQGCPNKTTVGGLRIVNEGFQMAMVRKDIITGSCWDFINKVYNNAGFQQANRETIYNSNKGTRYPTPELLQPGDWVYHVNYSYHNIEHSAIFICWKDYDKRMAVTLSYVGQNRSAPGKYGIYDLSGVYNVMRAKE